LSIQTIVARPICPPQLATQAIAENGGYPAEDVRAALAEILASAEFRKSPRLCRLFQFLMESQIAGAVRDTSEYGIGLDVFDRDPKTYSTVLDPIVRVQMGRLREKLKHFYETAPGQTAFIVSFPRGSYLPTLCRAENWQPAPPRPERLALRAFSCLSRDTDALAFAEGLNDELSHHLFQTWGDKLLPRGVEQTGASHVLEGSVRIDHQRVRVSIRLNDMTARVTVSSAQFDYPLPLDIALQETLAKRISDKLQGL